MNDPKNIEQEIQEVLRMETDAVSLSRKLFSPGGLFSQMAKSEEERRELVKSPLFRAAQDKLAQMRRTEANTFSQNVSQTQAAMPDKTRLFKLERSPT